MLISNYILKSALYNINNWNGTAPEARLGGPRLTDAGHRFGGQASQSGWNLPKNGFYTVDT